MKKILVLLAVFIGICNFASAQDKDTIQNVFTPNGDGINDNFTVPTDGTVVYKLQIFNRNGTLVYRNTSPNIMWDGNSNGGDPLPPGTYFYIIEGKSAGSNGEKFKKSGFVMLYRSKDDFGKQGNQ